ncbi:hypothetical protein BZA05DRAFT_63339, partial [Tricharina praecox]|uniref:uncharacterized protein n=1 Tax=Tricharina praecox TaxID=43433 RepID=UPI00221EA1F1
VSAHPAVDLGSLRSPVLYPTTSSFLLFLPTNSFTPSQPTTIDLHINMFIHLGILAAVSIMVASASAAPIDSAAASGSVGTVVPVYLPTSFESPHQAPVSHDKIFLSSPATPNPLDKTRTGIPSTGSRCADHRLGPMRDLAGLALVLRD